MATTIISDRYDSLDALWTRSYPGLSLSDDDATKRSFRPERPPLPVLEAATSHRRLSVLGEGGMGVVYRARQQSLEREVALKTLKGDDAQRFLSEALVTAYLDHPNILPIYELRSDVEGRPEIAMKLVEGQTWSERLARDTPWDRPEALEPHLDVLLKVCDAVAFAHSRGIVHLDLKPDNVMLGAFNEVLVLDWGLAHEIGEARGPRRAPRTSELSEPCGTPRYMPPELVLGAGDQVDERSDVYLLGGILCQVLSGEPPNRGESLGQVLFRAVEGASLELGPEVPEEARAIVARALSRDRAERFASARAFAEALRAFRAHRDSLRLTDKARGRLRAIEAEPQGQRAYLALNKTVAGFEQALDLWDGNAEARRGKDEAHRRTARAALASGDTSLARAQLAALSKGADDEGLLAEVDADERRRARSRTIQRAVQRILALAVIAIVAVLGYATLQAWRLEGEEIKNQVSRSNAARSLRSARVDVQRAEERHRREKAQSLWRSGQRDLEARRSGAALSLSMALELEEDDDARDRIRTRLVEARRRIPPLLWTARAPNGARSKNMVSPASIRSLAFDASGERLALAAKHEQRWLIRVHDAASGAELGRLSLEAPPLEDELSLAFDPAGQALMVLRSRSLETWRLGDESPASSRRLGDLGLPGGRGQALSYATNGAFFAIATTAEARVYRRGSKEPLPWRLSGPVTFLPDGRRFIAEEAGSNRRVTGELERPSEPLADAGLPRLCAPTALASNGCGLVGSQGRDLVYHNRETGKRATIAPRVFEELALALVAVAPRGGLVAAAERSGNAVRVYGEAEGSAVAQLVDLKSIEGLDFDRAGRLAIWSSDQLRVYDFSALMNHHREPPRISAFRSAIAARRSRVAATPAGGPEVLALSPSGDLRAEARPEMLFVRRVDGELVAELPQEFDLMRSAPQRIPEGDRPKLAAARRRIEQLDLGVLAGDTTARRALFVVLSVWPDASREEREELLQALLRGRFQSVISYRAYRALRFHPDGARLLALGGGGAYLWDLERGALIRRFSAAESGVFLDQGRSLALCHNKGRRAYELAIYRLTDGAIITRLDLPKAWRALLAAPVDGRFVLVATDSSKIHLYAPSGELLDAFEGPEDGSPHITLDPSGRFLAASRFDFYELFDVASGERFARLNALGELVFSADGARLAVAGQTGRVRVWDLAELRRVFAATPKRLVAEARAGLRKR